MKQTIIIMKKLNFLTAVLTFFIMLSAQGHQLSVSGIVTQGTTGQPLNNVLVVNQQTGAQSYSNHQGAYSIAAANNEELIFTLKGFEPVVVKVNSAVVNVSLYPVKVEIKEPAEEELLDMAAPTMMYQKSAHVSGGIRRQQTNFNHYEGQPWNTENYAPISENIFHDPLNEPLSTFSIDVDAASYSNVRRFLQLGQRPPIDAVRIEEMINYFDYEYAEPDGKDPFSVNTEVAFCPWNEDNLLVHIGLQGKKISLEELPPSNVVFLLDVSGSMNAPNKLPLLKSALKMLVEQLSREDRVTIVVYAGAAGMVLEPTPGNQKSEIISALENLQAGGSTAGGAGIKLAYKMARENFIEGGNNRIVLATDGDFNIGASSDAEMQRLIEKERESGVYLTVLGFGMGNYKDSKMEILADKGNGNYAYIDNMMEAKKVLVNEFGGTMFTIAKDVKIQVEFNPQVVAEYRLIGYENRKLNKEDFNDDKKDAGELGAGHSVTALYEVVLKGSNRSSSVDPLKYQKQEPQSKGDYSDEMLTVKLRYKRPDASKSQLITKIVGREWQELSRSSNNLKWSAAVAGFGMLLRNSEFAGNLTYEDVYKLAKSAQGKDQNGYRAEFLKLIGTGEILARK